MKDLEKEFATMLGKLIVEHTKIDDNDAIEDQYRYYSLKLGVVLQDMIPDKMSIEQQDKLIPVYKEFIKTIQEIKGEQ